MKDALNEDLITLSQAAKLIPSSHEGKKTSPSTLFRWAIRGLRGVRLRIEKVGGANRTSKKFLSEFFRELSRVNGLTSTPVADAGTDRSAEIARSKARVEALLKK